jgi:DNA polymerase elongation subunit (family B)
MSQWQFKLFEFDIREELETEKNDFVPGADTKQFIIQMYGIDEHGKTASIFVKGFKPFFYVKVSDDWDNSNVSEFVAFLRKEMGSYFGDSLISAKIVKRHKFYEFDNKKLYKFVQLKFTSIGSFNKCKNLWYSETKYGEDRKLKENGLEFLDTQTMLYEAQIPPLLRLFHIREIKPSGWIALKNGHYSENRKRLTTCDYEFTVNYKNIYPVNDKRLEKICVPFKILSLDIEASSSHGDFPLARKNYLKLATNIIDYLINNDIEKCDKDLLSELLKTGFSYRSYKDIEKVYLKKSITEEELDNLINNLVDIKPGKKENFIEIKDDEESDSSDVENNGIVEEVTAKKREKTTGTKNKDSNILEIINDVTCNRNTRILELAKCFGQHNPNRDNKWEGKFPELEGDQVTIIGSTLRRNGEDKPYLKHAIVVNDCNSIDNILIESYKTEKEALLAWTDFVQHENPDIIIGYNHHGWDEGFMYDRSLELGCMTQFSKLSRYKNEKCFKEIFQGKNKPKRIAIEESSTKLASGQFDLRYFKMSGRLQIDFLNLFRREEQLPSYKLDYVAGHFIGDTIKDIQYDEDYTILFSKNLTGLNVNDYIVIQEIGYSTDQYANGKKFKVLDIKDDIIILDEKITPDRSKVLRWCLGKDDVGPQDIFRLTNEGPEGRAIVTKYCIKDCDLVHDLMRKNDTMTSYDEMSNLCWVPKSFLVTRGQGIKLTSYVAQKCREKNTLMPVINKGLDDEGYEGAIVLEPKCNLYLKKPVACVDYSSLYPSSIISENISHDSKVWTKEYDLHGNLLNETGEKDKEGKYIYDELPEYEYINITYDTFKWIRKTPKAAATKVKSGYKTCRYVQFQNNEKAILPSILDELLGARKSTKRQMKYEKCIR